jgi:hypothetical protein
VDGAVKQRNSVQKDPARWSLRGTRAKVNKREITARCSVGGPGQLTSWNERSHKGVTTRSIAARMMRMSERFLRWRDLAVGTTKTTRGLQSPPTGPGGKTLDE